MKTLALFGWPWKVPGKTKKRGKTGALSFFFWGLKQPRFVDELLSFWPKKRINFYQRFFCWDEPNHEWKMVAVTIFGSIYKQVVFLASIALLAPGKNMTFYFWSRKPAFLWREYMAFLPRVFFGLAFQPIEICKQKGLFTKLSGFWKPSQSCCPSSCAGDILGAGKSGNFDDFGPYR